MDRRRRVLIVDEESSFRSQLAAAAREMGLVAHEARDSFGAFLKVSSLGERELSLDLMVVAVHMNAVSGVELLDHLEKHGYSIPVIFTSHFMDEVLFAGLMRKQCIDFIEKPSPPGEVAARIMEILQDSHGDRLPSRAVFRRRGGDTMVVEWSRSKTKG